MMNAILEQPEVRKRVHSWSVDDYHALGAAGCVDESVELLRGMIVEKMSKSPLHTAIVRRLFRFLFPHAEALGLDLFKEDPLTLADSGPEPDLAVVQPAPYDQLQSHPATAALVIEVAITSIEVDRGKAPIYAEAGIPEFWLVRPESSEIDIFSRPENGVYQNVETIGAGGVLTSAVFPDFSLPVDELFRSVEKAG
jgi:Uma2 family endonuclease